MGTETVVTQTGQNIFCSTEKKKLMKVKNFDRTLIFELNIPLNRL